MRDAWDWWGFTLAMVAVLLAGYSFVLMSMIASSIRTLRDRITRLEATALGWTPARKRPSATPGEAQESGSQKENE